MRRPYVILIGSASGIGKSTIAAELAKKLNIKHLVESDFIREVVRGIIGSEYAPALHSSSYNAYKTLRDKNRYQSYDELISAGFEEHASFVIPAIEKVIYRAINDYDDIILEGVHLVPGLIDLEQFKEIANIYFFVLASDEESHKERFVKRAVQIHRGGKQLDYFTENRIIHDHLLKKAGDNDVPVIYTESIDSSLKKMLRTINKSCRTIKLKNSLDELEDIIDILIRKHNGSFEKISYIMDGFTDPLVRNVNINETKEAENFLTYLNTHPNKKEEMEKLYNLSKYREFLICASDIEELNLIEKEFDEKGYLYKEI